jgi:chromosome segregation ATPase
MAEEEDCS